MYDLIGDIHGHADKLIHLLELLGYDRRRGYYSHPTRRVVFVGDFIDRGPKIREVLRLVRPMIDNDAALAVMGNHEFNAIAYHTRKAAAPGEFLRPHTQKNVEQHSETLRQVPPDELYDYVEWFRTLPMSLDLGELRVVHACWDPRRLSVIEEAHAGCGGVSDGFMAEALDRGTELYRAVEDVVKGKEIRLPDGQAFRDTDGHERHAMRIRWYESPENRTLKNYALPATDGFPSTAVPAEAADIASPYPSDAPPVFFGHYWLRDPVPTPLASNVACLDYSVAKSGKLCAYRWDGERDLLEEKFEYVEA